MPKVFIYKKPQDLNFSQNPIDYGFKILDYNQDIIEKSIFNCEVLMESAAYANDFEIIYRTSIRPDTQGFANLNFAKMIDANLSYFRPKIIQKKFYQCKQQSARFRINVTLRYQDADFVPSQIDNNHFAIKGGLAAEQWTPTALEDLIVGPNKPLHFYQPYEQVRINEPRMLYFILADDADSGLRLDNSITSINPVSNQSSNSILLNSFIQNTTARQYTVWCLPIDPSTLALQDLASQLIPGNVLSSYVVSIKDVAGNPITQASCNIDFKPYFQNIEYILYRNSIGGLDSIPIAGNVSKNIDISSTNIERVDTVGFFNNLDVKQKSNTSFQNIFTANTGFITKAKMEALQDLLMSKEVPVIIKHNRQIPVIIFTNKINLFTNKQMLYNMSFEYAHAFEDTNYTPELFVPVEYTCPGVTYLGLVQKRANEVTASWKLPDGYDKVEITYTVGGVPTTFISNGNYGEVSIYPNLSVGGQINVSARVVCNDEVAPFSYGPAKSYLFFVYTELAPVAVDDTSDETYRGLGSRTLLLNNAPLNLIANDIDYNSLYIDLHSICEATGIPTTTSQNGADLIATASPGQLAISYEPNQSSLAILQQDVFYYRVKQTTPNGLLVSNIAKVTVPMAGQIPKVYVKLNSVFVSSKDYKFGLLNAYTMGQGDLIKDLFLTFYKDASCTIPIDVTNMGLVISYFEDVTTDNYSNIGNITSSLASSNAVTSVNGSGVSMPLIIGWYQYEWLTNPDRHVRSYIKHSFIGASGNWVPVNF